MTHESKPTQEQHEKHEDPRKKVQVTVDRKKYEIAPGVYVVSVFKADVGVDPTKELAEVLDGKLVPLTDDARITIKGGEVFISHVRRGGSSWK